jgi:mercuric ion transport protein
MTEKKAGRTSDSALKWGALSALLASLCCLGPLVLILLGVGGASSALAIGYRKPYFLLLGIGVLGFGFYRLHRRDCRGEHLSVRRQLVIFGGAFTAAVLLYYLLTFVITPLLAPWVYRWRFGS